MYSFPIDYVLPFNCQASEAAANIRATLDKKGSGIGIPDVLVAGICIASSSPII
jgi:predicted nucleic acid-binding protein